LPTYLDELVSKYNKKDDNTSKEATITTSSLKKDSIDFNEKANSVNFISENKPFPTIPNTSTSETKINENKDLNQLTSIKDIVSKNDTDEKIKKLDEASNFEDYLSGKKSTLITKYDQIEIYRIEGEQSLHYKIPIPKPNPSQKLIINTLKEATTRLISTDPYKIRDPIQRRNIYYQKIIDILENASEINIPKHMFDFYADAVVKEMTGYGIIEPLLQDDKLEEVMIVGPKKSVYVYHSDYGMLNTNIAFNSDEEIEEIIDKIARTLGRQVDISNPILDARLPDGSRVNATIPPASIDGATVTIRKFRADPYTIVDIVNKKTVNIEVAAFLWSVVEGFGAKPANVLISGGTGSGKTTLLNVLANFIPEKDRILTIEDTAELQLPLKHLIRFEGRPPGVEGKGELSLDILTKNTLRMRPDRIIVGEIRHKEANALFTAMNTGHDGCMGTIHANSARETLVRITSPPMNVPILMLAGLDFIIIQKRLATPRGQVRRITAIAEVTGVLDNDPKANIIFQWNPQTDELERTELPIRYFDTIKTYTSLSDLDIKQKIESRIKILNEMVNNKVRELNDVSKIIQESYAKINYD